MRFKDLSPQSHQLIETAYAELRLKEKRYTKISVRSLYLLALACNRINNPDHGGSGKSAYYQMQ